MSRVGKRPITLDDRAEVTISGQAVTVKGPKGSLTFDVPVGLKAELRDGELVVEQVNAALADGAMFGMARSILQGLVTGVTQGFRKDLEIQGIGYRGVCQNNRLTLNLGFSHPVEYMPPEGVTVSMPNQTSIVVEGIDKQKVGQAAATIRGFRPPDNYKGKGIRYVGEYVPLKEGKTV